jgi:hypothetical protein
MHIQECEIVCKLCSFIILLRQPETSEARYVLETWKSLTLSATDLDDREDHIGVLFLLTSYRMGCRRV